MRRIGERLMGVGALLFIVFLLWAIVTGHGNYADPDDPPAAMVILMLVAFGTAFLGAFFRYVVDRRDVRAWFKQYKE